MVIFWIYNIVYSLVYPLPVILSSCFAFHCFSVCLVCFKVHVSNLIPRVSLLSFEVIQSIYCNNLYICVYVTLLPLIFALYVVSQMADLSGSCASSAVWEAWVGGVEPHLQVS